MFDWLRAKSAAKRMGLRDRGYIRETYEADADGENYILRKLCSACRTRARIGIKKDGTVVKWCHCCEIILSVVAEPAKKTPSQLIKLVKR